MTELDDDAVIGALSAAFETDLPQIPAAAHQAALRAFGWREVSASELLELLDDSADAELSGVRGASTLRALTFAGAGFTVRLTIDRQHVAVAVSPVGAFDCHLEQSGDEPVSFRTAANGEGTAEATSLPIRLRVTAPSGVVVTPWIIG